MVARRKFNGKQVFRIMQAPLISVMGVVMAVRTLVVDDSEFTRRMIRAGLQSLDWTICGEAENGSRPVSVFAARCRGAGPGHAGHQWNRSRPSYLNS